MLRFQTLIPIVACVVCATTWLGAVDSLSGTVQTLTGEPVAGATVRVKATGIEDRTDEQGRFRLHKVRAGAPLRITAWKNGFYVAGIDARAGQTDVRMTIVPYERTDHRDYGWSPPAVTRTRVEDRKIHSALDAAAQESRADAFFRLAEKLDLGCRDCHGDALHEQWLTSAHALGARNEIFLTMYNGTDVHGNRSPPTRRGYSRDYGSFPLRPDPDGMYYGPGYKLDFPETAGNCATCHLPGAALDDPYGTDPNVVLGVDEFGSHCDFCHKIAAVDLDPSTGRPRPNMPGVLSLETIRPGPEQQIFFGPYDDVDAGTDTFLPLMKESEICAPCHDASFWGTPIYESFAEWLASPYATRDEPCQACHMKPDGTTTNFAPGRGGIGRDPATVPTHGCPGAADPALLRAAVTTSVAAERGPEHIEVRVAITNDKTGHHVPTDSPLRQLILLVQATDAQGTRLTQVSGPTVPSWGGEGDPAMGHYAGQPGKGFAKILRETWTGISPTAAYWNPTRIVKDNRIAAYETDTSEYRFDAPRRGPVRIEVELLFRRAFIDLARQKGWDTPDIVMSRRSLTLETPTRVQP